MEPPEKPGRFTPNADWPVPAGPCTNLVADLGGRFAWIMAEQLDGTVDVEEYTGDQGSQSYSRRFSIEAPTRFVVWY